MQSRWKRAMHGGVIAALVATLIAAGSAQADTVAADGDAVTAGPQSVVDLGKVAPSAVITLEVPFTLVCANGSHVDAGQVATMEPAGGIVPAGGEIVSMSGGTTAPTPPDWTADGVLCPVPAPLAVGGTPATVVLRAPAADGDDLDFLVSWTRTLAPAGTNDSRALTGAPALTVRLDVVSNTPPVVTAPASMTVEADTVGGWVVDLAALVHVDDAEDDPDPGVVCDVADGATLPLGTTLVACTATDSAGASDGQTFPVEVVDSTAPTIDSVAGMRVETPDPQGVAVLFDAPSAGDVADPEPSVVCSPAAGTSFPVGVTIVSCTATDASGNASRTSFALEVVHVPPVAATASWLEPLGVSDGGTFVANRGRTVPVKVVISVGGLVRTTGTAQLVLEPCTGTGVQALDLSFGGGRWNTALETSQLPHACYEASALLDGVEAGSFRLDLRGGEATKARARGR